MATLKDHQQAMIDLLASGSGIPASASRLAHAMHDVLEVLSGTAMGRDLKDGYDVRCDATTPGLNDKALAADIEACRPKDTMFDRARAAERRVKALENTCNQLRASNAKLRNAALETGASYADLGVQFAELVKILAFYGVDDLEKARAEYLKYNSEPEQAGCRKDDTQVCDHEFSVNEDRDNCLYCGASL